MSTFTDRNTSKRLDLNGKPTLLQAVEALNVRRLDGLYKPVFGRWQDTECPVCLEIFARFNSVAVLPCGHIVHHFCIVEVLTKMQILQCPQCRGALLTERVDAAVRAEHDPDDVLVGMIVDEVHGQITARYTPPRDDSARRELTAIRALNADWAEVQRQVAGTLDHYFDELGPNRFAGIELAMRLRSRLVRLLFMPDDGLARAISDYVVHKSHQADRFANMAEPGRFNFGPDHYHEEARKARLEAIFPSLKGVASHYQDSHYIPIDR